MKKRNRKIVDQQLAVTGQNVDLVIVERPFGTSITRYSIRSNAYQHQCHARSEVWGGKRWRLVHSILPGAMQTPSGLYSGAHKRITVADLEPKFLTDLAHLRTVTENILGGE